MTDRVGLVKFKGQDVALVGHEVKVGDAAPDFTAITAELSEVKLSDFRGKAVLVASVPSLDTSVCSIEAGRFNLEAASLGDDVKVLVVSMDLPFAQKRWCGSGQGENILTLSDHRDANFGTSYGMLIKEFRLLARSAWVIDREGVVRYCELVKEISNEPDYAAALNAVGELLDK